MMMVMSTTSSFPSLRLRTITQSPAFHRTSLNLKEYEGSRKRRWALQNNPTNDDRTAVVTVTAPPSTTQTADDESGSVSSSSLDSGANVVRKFYGGINGRDLASVEDLIADNCVYEDLVFPLPFVGRKAILNFFKKFIDSISTDLQFVIDEISEEDTAAVGVTWHLEWKGRPFPFSKGCSFYKLEVVNGQRKIIYGRDSVEPAIKPGEMALVAIRGVTWLLQKFPQLADRL